MELRYEPLERLHVASSVDRIGYVIDACRGRTVLDLGAMDETGIEAKRGHGTWLHEAIASVGKEVLGVDSSSKLPEAGLVTTPNARIVRGTSMRSMTCSTSTRFFRRSSWPAKSSSTFPIRCNSSAAWQPSSDCARDRS